jgi:hypothetical protein
MNIVYLMKVDIAFILGTGDNDYMPLDFQQEINEMNKDNNFRYNK